MNIEEILNSSAIGAGTVTIQSSQSAFKPYEKLNQPKSTSPLHTSTGKHSHFEPPIRYRAGLALSENGDSGVVRNQPSPPHHGMLPDFISPIQQKRKHQQNNRRPRTTFNAEQSAKLEHEYVNSEYVSRSRRIQMAKDLNLSESQIKIWFQNRRAKDKRIEKAQIDSKIRYITALSLQAVAPQQITSCFVTSEAS